MNHRSRLRRGGLAVLMLTASALPAIPAVGLDTGALPHSDPRLEWIGQPFQSQRIGTRSAPYTLRLTNVDVLPLQMGPVTIENDPRAGAAGEDGVSAFAATTDCPGALLLPGANCEVAITFTPHRIGPSSMYLRIVHDGMSRQTGFEMTGTGTLGLFMAGGFGEVLTFGDARSHGDLTHVDLDTPVLGIAATPSGQGYWLLQAGGEVHPFGDAPPLEWPSLPPDDFAVGIAATPTGQGYWIATGNGDVYGFGDAGDHGGAAGDVTEDAFVIGISSTPTGGGYWLVDTAGDVHPFGDAGFFGAPIEAPALYPITAMAPTPSGQGYWVLDAEGGIFAYGDATGFPSEQNPNRSYFDSEPNPYVAIEAAPTDHTIWYATHRGATRSQGERSYGYDYSNGYGSSGLEPGSGVVDLAVDVRSFTPSEDSGTVQVVPGRTGPRLP